MKNLVIIFLLLVSLGLVCQTASPPTLGDGSVDDPYQIETLENLFWIAAPDSIVPVPDQAARWSSHYIQTENIDASPTQNWFPDGQGGFYGWLPIGGYIQFSGSYDGAEHTISDLYINRSANYLGLLGITTEASVIQNLGLIDVDISVSAANPTRIGALIGQCFGIVDNCYASGNIIGGTSTGGLIGELYLNGTINNSYTEGNATGGGLVGINRGLITNSHSSSIVTSTVESSGGFVSYNEGTIDNCYSSGTVSGGGNHSAGGFIYNNSGTITNSYATGAVSAYAIRSGGGFAAENGNTISNCYATGNVSGGAAGGFVAVQNYSGSVDNSYATGNVTNTYSWFPMYAGGFIGINYGGCIISNCYSRGNVIRDHNENSAFLGGFIGKNQQGIITNCFSTGFVAYNFAANPEDKGFAAAVDTTGAYAMSGNYWDMETSLQSSTAGEAEGRFTSNMTSPYATNTYINWDFVDIWAEDVNYTFNNGYPYLSSSSVFVNEELPIFNFTYLKNYPNPFNPSTTIEFSIKENEAGVLSIYNLRGEKILKESFEAGNHQYHWNAEGLASGLYFYKLSSPTINITRKMILMK